MPPVVFGVNDVFDYDDTLHERKLTATDDYVTFRVNKNDSAVDILETILDAIE